MLSPDEFVGAGEVFCVSDLAETVSLSSVGDSDKTSIVEVIVEFCSDTGELVDISVLMMCLLGKGSGFLAFSRFVVVVAAEAGHVPTDGLRVV